MREFHIATHYLLVRPLLVKVLIMRSRRMWICGSCVERIRNCTEKWYLHCSLLCYNFFIIAQVDDVWDSVDCNVLSPRYYPSSCYMVLWLLLYVIRGNVERTVITTTSTLYSTPQRLLFLLTDSIIFAPTPNPCCFSICLHHNSNLPSDEYNLEFYGLLANELIPYPFVLKEISWKFSSCCEDLASTATAIS